MPQLSDFIILELPAQHTLSVNTRTEVSKLPELITQSYQRIGSIIEDKRVFFSGMPYVAYYNMDEHDLHVEVGIPVSQALKGEGDVVAGELPAGRFASCMYLGSYAEMAPVYEAMGKWVAEQGLKPLGVSYEMYFNGPSQPEEMLLTEVRFALQ